MTNIKALIESTASIEEIHTHLKNYIQDKISTEACCKLVVPLFKHAIENPTNPLEAYVDVLVDIHTYLSQCALMDRNVIFKDVAGILRELLYIHQAEGDFTALFNRSLDKEQFMRVIALASAACLEVLRLFNGSESEPICTALWRLAPESIHMFVEEVAEQNVVVIINLSAIAACLLYKHTIIPTDDEVSLLLFNMVAATLKYIAFEDHINLISSYVSKICAATPDLELPYTSDLSDLVNSLAASLVQSNNHTLCKAMFNVSLLLARNNAATPWLLDFDTTQYEDREIEVIKQMIAAIYEGKAPDLITKLANTETGSKECAMLLNELEYVAVHCGTTVESLCNPYMKEITECVARRLWKDRDLATTIVSRIGYELPKFLKKYLHFALPYAVLDADSDAALFGLGLVFKESYANLVRQGASHVAIAILLEENSAAQHVYKKKLDMLFGETDVWRQLVMDNQKTMMMTAAMNLGHPTQGRLFQKAMETINSIINGPVYNLSDFLSEQLLGILVEVFGYITQVKIRSLDLRHPYALQSLKIIIHLLDQDAVKFNINTIMKGLCTILEVSPSSIRVQIANTLHDMLVHNKGITAEEYANFPVLPDFEELAAVKRIVRERQEVKVNDEVLSMI